MRKYCVHSSAKVKCANATCYCVDQGLFCTRDCGCSSDYCENRRDRIDYSDHEQDEKSEYFTELEVSTKLHPSPESGVPKWVRAIEKRDGNSLSKLKGEQLSEIYGGATPLGHCIYVDWVGGVQILCKLGSQPIDPCCRDASGVLTARQYAKRMGRTVIDKFLTNPASFPLPMETKPSALHPSLPKAEVPDWLHAIQKDVAAEKPRRAREDEERRAKEELERRVPEAEERRALVTEAKARALIHVVAESGADGIVDPPCCSMTTLSSAIERFTIGDSKTASDSPTKDANKPERQFPQPDHNHSRLMIPSSEISLGAQLGSGNFGSVIKAQWHGGDVAVKLLHSSSETSNDDLLQELATLEALKHTHVVNLFGYTYFDENLCLVTELLDCSLLTVLADSTLPDLSRIKIARDICSGMSYLASRNVVHRDLAARNVLLSVKARNVVAVKIADFGLARSLSESGKTYYSTRSAFPKEWTAPEAIKHRKFSEKSDVWSFGITLWEIESSGAVPYNTWNCYTLNLLVDALQGGKRLEKPIQCLDVMDSVMRLCWHINPTDRPAFSFMLPIFSQALQGSANINSDVQECDVALYVDLNMYADVRSTVYNAD